MLFCSNLKNLIIIIFIFITYGCTNTRIIVEGTKKVLEIKKIDKKEQKENTIKGHYKVGNPYVVDGIEYKPKLLSEYNENGIASWYGPNFHNKMTANGEIFDQDSISAAPSSISSDEGFDIAYAHARKKTDRNLIETVEKEIIQRALKECGGNQVKASALLGITRATLRKRIDVFEIRY